jgi:hypothetical protein
MDYKEPITCSQACSLSCSLLPNKNSSSLRALSPCLEPEKELPCLGEAIPALIFTENTVQISFVRPPTRTSQGVGSRSIHLPMPGVDPDRLQLRVCLGLRPSQPFPGGLPRFAMVARCGVTLCCRLASRDCNSLAPEAVGLFEPRHLAPPTTFSGLFLSVAPEAEAASGSCCKRGD